MSQVIQGVPFIGDTLEIETTVRTGGRSHKRIAAIGSTSLAVKVGGSMLDVVHYEGSKNLEQCLRRLALDVVRELHPEADQRMQGFMMHASVARDGVFILRTPEEIAAEKAVTSGRRWHLRNAWLQIGYAWTGVYMAIDQVWRAIRG